MTIEPHDISAPRGIVDDVTGIGRWGNGNSEVRLNRIEVLSYAVDLARRALERQLDQEKAT